MELLINLNICIAYHLFIYQKVAIDKSKNYVEIEGVDIDSTIRGRKYII